MKLGQLLSFIDLDLPPEVRSVYHDALARLRDDAPPVDPDAIERVVLEDFGAPVDEVFASWEREPLAAASIGQVHAAKLHDGREVVAKVQYPGVAEAVRSDLSNAEMFAPLARWFSPNQELEPLLDELRERIDDELDYEREAQYQRAFADRYADHPFIVVPDVVGDLCRNRVLVSERIHGRRFDESPPATTSPAPAGGRDHLPVRLRLDRPLPPVQRRPPPGQLPGHRRRSCGLPRLRQRQDVHPRALRVDAARGRRGGAGRPGGLPRRDARDPVPPAPGRHRRGHALGLVPPLHPTHHRRAAVLLHLRVRHGGAADHVRPTVAVLRHAAAPEPALGLPAAHPHPPRAELGPGAARGLQRLARDPRGATEGAPPATELGEQDEAWWRERHQA